MMKNTHKPYSKSWWKMSTFFPLEKEIGIFYSGHWIIFFLLKFPTVIINLNYPKSLIFLYRLNIFGKENSYWSGYKERFEICITVYIQYTIIWFILIAKHFWLIVDQLRGKFWCGSGPRFNPASAECLHKGCKYFFIIWYLIE
jgi:hypothetical protein